MIPWFNSPFNSLLPVQRRDSFKEHMLIHNGPRYRCPHCPKEFVQKSNLTRHIRIHTNVRPYKCDHCEKTFTDRGACSSHMKVHSGENKQVSKDYYFLLIEVFI